MKRSKLKKEEFQKPSIAAASGFASSVSEQPPNMFASESMTLASNAKSAEAEASSQESNVQDIDQGPQEEDKNSNIRANKMLGALHGGHHFFRSTSRFDNVQIRGPLALGGPGCLAAPKIKGVMMSELASQIDTPVDFKMADAVSEVISEHLDTWRQGLVVPNQMWYPGFAYFPGPYAPPMPNIPSRLSKCPSFGEYLITNEDQIFQDIMARLPSDMETDANINTVRTFSEMASSYFEGWLNIQLIHGIFGGGKVHGFSPPMSFGGKVVGKVLTVPGALD